MPTKTKVPLLRTFLALVPILVGQQHSNNAFAAFLEPGTNPTKKNLVSERKKIAATRNMGGFGDFLRDFGKELDNLIDDAMDRKLGGGSTFYGERKSSFSRTKKSYRDMAMGEEYKREVARRDLAPSSTTAAAPGSGGITGEELRALISEKWGQRFPVLIKRRRDALGEFRLYLVVQWKYVGKSNLDLSEEEYVAESDAVADLITEWGQAGPVKEAIKESNARPKTMTQQFPGLFVPLDVDRDIIDTW